MINLMHWPNECISGLTMDEIRLQRELFQLNDVVEKEMYEDFECPTLDELCALLPDESTSDLEAIAAQQYEDTKVVSTERQEIAAVERFKQFLTTNAFLPFDIDLCSEDELASKLRLFYATLRKEDGSLYAPTSLICARAGLFRYFRRVRSLNIIENDKFHAANLALKAVARLFLKAGGRINHYEAISEEDEGRLARYFDRASPTTLLHEVYFVLIYFFGQRGREWFRGLDSDSLVFEDNADCGTLVRLRTGLQKNLGRELNAGAMSDNREAVIKATGTTQCPVQALRLYLEKRREALGDAETEGSPLLLTPKKSSAAGGPWYTKQPVGVNTVGGMMKTISTKAALSKIYTPHNIRPTVVADLHQAGFRLEQICKITGHKEAKTVQR